MENLMQDKKECLITGDTNNLHAHHCYGGGRRKSSEKYGCWVWLRADWHNASDYGVHFNPEVDLALKKGMQEAFEKIHGHEKFMEVFGKNYL